MGRFLINEKRNCENSDFTIQFQYIFTAQIKTTHPQKQDSINKYSIFGLKELLNMLFHQADEI